MVKFFTCLYVLMFLIAVPAFAAGSGQPERWMLSGYYGLGFVNPSDINSIANSQNTTPKLNSLSSKTFYGGSIGAMLSSKLQFKITYDIQDAKNGVNTTNPFRASGAGFELMQNEIWGSLNYFLFHSGRAYGYAGGSIGYPAYSHVASTLALNTGYDADKTIGYMGQLGLGVSLGQHFSIFAEGRYQYLVSGTLKTSSGSALTLPNGSNAKMDLSGFGVLGGLALLL